VADVGGATAGAVALDAASAAFGEALGATAADGEGSEGQPAVANMSAITTKVWAARRVPLSLMPGWYPHRVANASSSPAPRMRPGPRRQAVAAASSTTTTPSRYGIHSEGILFTFHTGVSSGSDFGRVGLERRRIPACSGVLPPFFSLHG
jgi:hypothetical protein